MFGPTDFRQYVLTHHAEQRMAQRNISLGDVYFVLEFGQKLHRAGAVFFHLGKCDIPSTQRRQSERLEGTVVVLSRDMPVILTVYRNRQGGLGRIKRKSARSRYPKYYGRADHTAFWRHDGLEM